MCESEVAQLCLTLSDPMDSSLPGSSIHGIFQARVLEWGAIAFSGLIHYRFLNPSETITSEKYAHQMSILLIDEMHQNCNVCSFVQQREPNSSPWQYPTKHCTTNASKVEWIGLQCLVSSAIFTWPLANWPPFLQAYQKLFTGKIFPQPAGGRKCFQEFVEFQSMDFYATGINKLISCWQKKYVDCNGSYFD